MAFWISTIDGVDEESYETFEEASELAQEWAQNDCSYGSYFEVIEADTEDEAMEAPFIERYECYEEIRMITTYSDGKTTDEAIWH